MTVRCGHIQTSVLVCPLCHSFPVSVIVSPGYICTLVLLASEGVSLGLPLVSRPCAPTLLPEAGLPSGSCGVRLLGGTGRR